jgi:ABC-type transport system involved in Fe-S cluster assembly fused permease/ATPase subunit
LANFPILVLDEPGEHLDPPAADALTADLLGLTEGHSTLLITHRLTGLEQVDEIVVLDEGRVVERGTHSDLVVSGGHYAALWWDELMNDWPPVEPRTPSTEGLSAVLNEGSDTP